MATLITGASSGIGAELAKRFAVRGDDLVLVARSREKMEKIAKEIREKYGVEVGIFTKDLAKLSAAEELFREISDAKIEVLTLVNNAGFATHGDVADADAQKLQDEISVDVQNLVGLTTRFLPAMVLRKQGEIINISSTAAFQALPHMAVYGASKAFVLSFSEALFEEVRGKNIRILAVCPGPTRTPFFEIAGENSAVGKFRTVEQLCDNIMKNLSRKNKPMFVDGLANAAQARIVPRLVPRKFLTRTAGKLLDK